MQKCPAHFLKQPQSQIINFQKDKSFIDHLKLSIIQQDEERSSFYFKRFLEEEENKN